MQANSCLQDLQSPKNWRISKFGESRFLDGYTNFVMDKLRKQNICFFLNTKRGEWYLVLASKPANPGCLSYLKLWLAKMYRCNVNKMSTCCTCSSSNIVILSFWRYSLVTPRKTNMTMGKKTKTTLWRCIPYIKTWWISYCHVTFLTGVISLNLDFPEISSPASLDLGFTFKAIPVA